MSNKSNEPWSLQEKIELLVNILQVQHQYLQRDLVGFLAQNVHQNPGFSWNEVPLPRGRSVLACQAICDALNATPRLQLQHLQPQQQPQPQQQSFGPVNPPPPGPGYAGPPQPPQHQVQAQAQTPSQSLPQPQPQPQQPQQPQQRVFAPPFDGEQPQAWIQHQQQHPRAIQPRPSRSTDSPNPASTNGEPLTIMRTTAPELAGERRRRKRGRPTKEEAEERDRQLAAEGKVYEPKKRPAKKFRASTGTPGTPGPPVSDVALSPLVQQQSTPLARAQEAPTEESSSSGKRRSKRQASFARGEPTSPTIRPVPVAASAHDLSEPSGAESPSDRLFARFSERDRDRDRFPPHPPAAPASPTKPPASEESGPSATA